MRFNYLTITYCFILLLIVLLILSIISSFHERNVLKHYRKIHIGMTEQEMLMIMGGKPITSSLKNNRFKYEWRINGTSSTTGRNGFYTTSYSGVKKVDIYIKDGLVEEIKPYNI